MNSYFLHFLILLQLLHITVAQFVTVDPTNPSQFLLNGKRFNALGTNQYGAGIYLRPEQVQDLMRQNKEMGVQLLRVWAFNNEGCGITGCFMSIDAQTKKITMNDQAMQRLDNVLFYARQFGIKILLAPSNWNADFGGMQWWVDQILGYGHSLTEFYIHPSVQKAYTSWLSMLVNRKNSITGVLYKEDPTIFGWDLANEPKLVDGVDSTGKIVSTWVCATSNFIKVALGVKQLLTTGEEGYMTKGQVGGAYSGHEWMQTGLKGTDFETNANCKSIDFLTIHLYPDQWEIPYFKFADVMSHFVQERAQVAQRARKPLLVEEFGCCSDRGWDYRGNRLRVFQQYLDIFKKNKVAGFLVWQMFPSQSRLFQDWNYDFTPATDAASANVILKELGSSTGRFAKAALTKTKLKSTKAKTRLLKLLVQK